MPPPVLIHAQLPHDQDEPGGELRATVVGVCPQAPAILVPQPVEDERVAIHAVVGVTAKRARGTEDQVAVRLEEALPGDIGRRVILEERGDDRREGQAGDG